MYPHMKNDVIVSKTCTSTEIDINAESRSQRYVKIMMVIHWSVLFVHGHVLIPFPHYTLGINGLHLTKYDAHVRGIMYGGGENHAS